MTYQAGWGLIDIINEFGPDVQGIEIGVNQGTNTYMLLDACPNIRKIIGVDPYLAYDDWLGHVEQKLLDEAYDYLMQNMPLMRGRFELMKMKSTDAASSFEDGAYDFVFIDGDHSIKGVLNDLENYMPKVRSGGIIAGHDIGLYSVNTAIGAWIKKRLINPMDVQIVENQAWYYRVK